MNNQNPYRGQNMNGYGQNGYQQPAYEDQNGYQEPVYEDQGGYQEPVYEDQNGYQQPAYEQNDLSAQFAYKEPEDYQPAPAYDNVQRGNPAQSANVQRSQPTPPDNNAPQFHPEPKKVMGEIVISARNIHKTFGKGDTAQVVLDGANLDIEKGSFVSLMGESGTGKSTLLYLIGGLDRDFTGDILVAGNNIVNLKDGELSEIRCKKMGFVFQFYNLAANLTVEDNILLPLEMSGRKISDYREKYREILEITGLESKVKSYPSQLSGGQQQRVAIARAVLGDPEIILADEPTGNLDAASGAEIMELFSRLNKERGVTILQVTHSAEAASYSSRIVTLKNRVITG